jgi:hypothetical protein
VFRGCLLCDWAGSFFVFFFIIFSASAQLLCIKSACCDSTNVGNEVVRVALLGSRKFILALARAIELDMIMRRIIGAARVSRCRWMLWSRLL